MAAMKSPSKRVKGSRILLVAKSIGRGPRVLVVGGLRDIVAAITLHFRDRNCRVYQHSDFQGRLFPCEYVILLGEENQLISALHFSKRCRARIVFVRDKKSPPLGLATTLLLRNFYDQGLDVRLAEVEMHEDTSVIVQEIERLLFAAKKNAGLENLKDIPIPLPPPPVPIPPLPDRSMEKKPADKISRKDYLPVEERDTVHRKSYGERKFFFSRIFVFVLGSLLLLAILSPAAYFFFSLTQGIASLQTLETKLASGILTSSEVAVVQERFAGLNRTLQQILAIVGPLGATKPAKNLTSVLTTCLRLTSAIRHSVNLAKLGKDAGSSLFANQSLLVAETLLAVKSELEAIDEDLVGASAALADLQSITVVGKDVLAIREKIADVLTITKLGRTLIPILPELFGLEGKRVYLVLFQNNMELRPTGGFIGSYGLFTFDKGKLIDMSIEDVYTADGQLRGHIEPPAALKKYLFLEHWYLRDANFDPEFANSARQAEWFLQKEMGVRVDGVFAVDLTFAKRVLDALGGLTLPDYDERLTSDNFFIKAQVVVQDNFFPGSTQKKDFLAHFARSLIREFTTRKNLSWMRLGHALKTSLDEKHILVFLHDKKLQAIFDDAGWGGRLLPATCNRTALPCIPDYFFLVDANVGVNKANYYLERLIEYGLTVSPGIIDHNITVNYHNTTPADVFPSGPYRNYARVFLPKEAVQIEIFVDNIRLSEEDYQMETQQDKTVIELYLEVPIKDRRRLTIRYTLMPPQPFPPSAYQLIVQKQPGTERDPFHLQITTHRVLPAGANFPLPDSVSQVLGARENTLANGVQFTYNSDLAIDRVFSMIFK